MSKEELEKRFLKEKNANLIDIMEFASDCYAKALVNLADDEYEIRFKYYKIDKDLIIDLTDEESEKIRKIFEIDYGNIVY